MDPTINTPERGLTPVVSQFNAMPDLGGMAANMPQTNPNAVPTMPNVAPTIPEVAPMGSPEQLSNPETQLGPGQSTTPTVPMPVIPVPQQPVVVQPTTTTSDNSSATAAAPATAADSDLIEKEWVDHAKKIISSTRSDPHEQARLVAELMRDYVKKRYGKEVGKAPDD